MKNMPLFAALRIVVATVELRNATPSLAVENAKWQAERELLHRDRFYLHNIKSITLKHGTLGPNQAGARAFRAEYFRPIEYWNPDITLNVEKVENEKDVAPVLSVELANDSAQDVLDFRGNKRAEHVLSELLERYGKAESR